MKTLNQLATNNRLRYVVVNRLETRFWSDEVQKNVKAAYGQWLVDLTEPTNCCELAVSYPAYFIRNEFVGSKFDEERTFDLERENGGDSCEYWRGDTFAEPVSSCYLSDKDYLEQIEDGHQQWIERQIEHYKGNFVGVF